MTNCWELEYSAIQVSDYIMMREKYARKMERYSTVQYSTVQYSTALNR